MEQQLEHEVESNIDTICEEFAAVQLKELLDNHDNKTIKLSDATIQKLKTAYDKKYLTDEDQHTRYLATVDNVCEVIDKFGVAIIPNVLNNEELDDMVNGMWDYLEHITKDFNKPVKRNDHTTYRSFFDLLPLHGMLIQHWQAGHAQFVWNLRQNPKLVNIFAKIWNVKPEELTVSFDGIAISLPHEDTNRGYYRGNKWYHTDQNAHQSDFQCIQSWVTGFDVRGGDATLTILEGSHKYHAEIKKKIPNAKKEDWCKLDEDTLSYFTDDLGCKIRNIVCDRGSLVLWDSRTIHAGKEPLKKRDIPNYRLAVYLCYTPKSLLSAANCKKKQKAFNEKRLTSHWPHKVKLFPKNPRLYSGQTLPQVAEVPNPELTTLGKSLAGF